MNRHKGAEAELRRRVGREIARRMVGAGKKPADLASAAEIDDSQVSKVLAGRVGLSLYSLGRVAGALGCTSADILAAAADEGPTKGAKQRRSDVLDHARTLRPRRGPATN